MTRWIKDAEHGGYYDDACDSGTSPQLISDEPDTFTGLLDANGNPLHRQRPRIGFALE